VRTTLLSSESAGRSLRTTDHVEKLRTLARDNGVTCRVVLVAREQLDHLNAMYCSRVLDMEVYKDFDSFVIKAVGSGRYDLAEELGALLDAPEVELVAVADVGRDRADLLATSLRVRAYGNAADMFAAERPDIAVVATPDPFHRDPIVAAAEAKVPNLITEKPMATTEEDARAMYAAAERNGSRLWVHLPTRTAPQEIAARYVYQQGLVGEPIYGDLIIDDNISVPTHMWRDRSKAWASMSSTAQFLFSHTVDRMRWLFEPAEVDNRPSPIRINYRYDFVIKEDAPRPRSSPVWCRITTRASRSPESWFSRASSTLGSASDVKILHPERA